MSQGKIIDEYLKTQTENWLQEDLPAMKQEFWTHRGKITEFLATSISQIFQQAILLQETGRKGPATYLWISFLRVNILNDIWQYRLDLYDGNFFSDKTECTSNWELDFVWKYLKRRIDQLGQTISKGIYANKIRQYHRDKIKLTMAFQYHQIIVKFTQQIIKEALQTPEYDSLIKGSTLKILMGEYFDHSVLLYEKQCDTEKRTKKNAILPTQARP